jgi:YaaC-like Protein
MGRLPAARDGKPAVIKGIPLIAGLALRERRFTSRARAEELWSPLEVAASPSGRKALCVNRYPHADDRAQRRFSAYVGQAQSFYLASIGLDVLSRPLLAYYAILNLAKAWVTLCDPVTTESKIYHGTVDRYKAKSRYYFAQEALSFEKNGVFAEVAKRSATGFFYAQRKTVAVAELAPYLAETNDEFEGSIDEPPKLIPLDALEVWRSAKSKPSGGELWLRAKISRDVLTARNISGSRLLERAYHFGQQFDQVSIAGQDAYRVYETKAVLYKGRNPTSAVPDLTRIFEDSLIHVNRSAGTHRYFLVLEKLHSLLSQEAVAFAVLNHLSNMVRYRPDQVERLAAEKWSWLLGTWVPRVLENALLTYSTRILDEEMRIY